MKKIKKIAGLILTGTLLMSTSLTAFASNFTPSVTAKTAPEVVTQTGTDGKEYIAIIKDVNGEEVAGVAGEHIIVTPVAERDNAADAIAEKLENAYNQVKAVANLMELFKIDSDEVIDVTDSAVYTTDSVNPLVAAIAAYRENVAVEEASKNITVEDLVVRDLFDVTISDEHAEYLAIEGNTLTIRFELSTNARALVSVLHNMEGDTWEVIGEDRIIRNDDNTVDVTFDSLSPIVFAFDSNQLGIDTTDADTEDSAVSNSDAADVENTEEVIAAEADAAEGSNIIWIVLAVIVIAVVVMIISKNKKSDSDKK